MISLDRLEHLLKEGGTLEEEEARRILQENATSGGLLREAAEKGFLNVVKFFVEAKEHFNLTCEEELMCSTSVGLDRDFNTVLHVAASNGHGNIVEYLMSPGLPIQECNRNLETPLYLACGKGHEIVAEVLLQHGVSISAFCVREYHTEIEVASVNGHASIVQRLLDSGAPPEKAIIYAAQKGHADIVTVILSHYKNTGPSLWIVPLGSAAANGHAQMCEMLFDVLSDRVNGLDLVIKTISYAAKHGHINIVHFLLSRSALLGGIDFSVEPFTSANSQPTALDLAITEGHIAIARLLLLHGFSLSKTFLLKQMIKKSRYLAVLSLIAMGADLNSIDPTTLLHLACCGKLEMVEFVLQRGMSVNARNSDLDTPLHTACGHNSDEGVVKFLISRGAELNAVNKEGKTPLHVATHFSIQKALIESGADPNIPLNTGETLLHLTKSVELAELLLGRNMLVDARTTEGETPLMYACRSGHRDIVSLLLKHGASVNTMNESQSTTPLLAAVEKMWHDIVELLLENDADVNLTCDTESALRHACLNHDAKCALLLLKWGVEVNARYADDYTPLHCAVVKNVFMLVRVLLEYGADVNAFSQDGKTPLYLVRSAEVSRLLFDKGADVSLVYLYGQTPLRCDERELYEEVVSRLLEYLSLSAS